MSDLLPIVVAALNDKIAAEANSEIQELKKQLNLSRSVEIVRSAKNDSDDESVKDNVAVYATADFLDGSYAYGKSDWVLDLKPGAATCSAANLRHCHVCVGGGFPVASLSNVPNRAPFSIMFDDDEEGDEVTRPVTFKFCPFGGWVRAKIHGWPRNRWEEVDGRMEHAMLDELVDNFPDATIEFREVSFDARHIHGAIKRVLPPRIREEAERDGQENQEYTEFTISIITFMRQAGNNNFGSRFLEELQEIVEQLSQINIFAVNDETEEIVRAMVNVFVQLGRAGLVEIIQDIQQQLNIIKDEDENQMEE